eukprot:gene25958-biopygen12254
MSRGRFATGIELEASIPARFRCEQPLSVNRNLCRESEVVVKRRRHSSNCTLPLLFYRSVSASTDRDFSIWRVDEEY